MDTERIIKNAFFYGYLVLITLRLSRVSLSRPDSIEDKDFRAFSQPKRL